MTEETRKKMSIAKKNKLLTEKQLAALSKARGSTQWAMKKKSQTK